MWFIIKFVKMDPFFLQKTYIQSLDTSKLRNAVNLNVLRLDLLHPQISGNKWFKLKLFLEEAKKQSCFKIATFGGYYSNHILATAAACNYYHLSCTLFVRGNEPKEYSATLRQCKDLGATLVFLNKNDYLKLKINEGLKADVYFIPEGGNGTLGIMGAATIYANYKLENYDFLIGACGTGTTITGILRDAKPHQTVIGINVLKGYENLQQEIVIKANNSKARFNLLNDFHFGGYAKYTKVLLDFMNDFYTQHQIPTDFVYTGKLFYAVQYLVNENFFALGSKVLVIHSGGIQGNAGLPKSSVVF